MALFTLLIAVRLLSPTGYMPNWDQGRLAIAFCPDASPAMALAHGMHHHSGERGKQHQPCPFGAMSTDGITGSGVGHVATAPLFAAGVVVARAFAFLPRHRDQDRPPLRSPPVPA